MKKLMSVFLTLVIFLVCVVAHGAAAYFLSTLIEPGLRDDNPLTIPVIPTALYVLLIAARMPNILRRYGANPRRLVSTQLYICRIFMTPFLVATVLFFCSKPLFGHLGELSIFIITPFVTAVVMKLFSDIDSAPEPTVRRGRTLTPFEEATEKVRSLSSTDSVCVAWGGLRIPIETIEGHFCVIGSTGSGKSLTLRLLMQSVFAESTSLPPRRAAVYDAKRDVYSVLVGMGISPERIRILNPFDARCCSWDMSKDIRSPGTADQIARILVPREEGPNRFFADAAADLLAGVIKAFILRGESGQVVPWTFRDVLLALQNQKRLERILRLHHVTLPLVDEYFQEERTFQAIRSTLRSHMAGYETVAALWARSAEKISLVEWLQGDHVLVIGNDDSLRIPIDAINRVIFQRLTELLLTQATGGGIPRTWVFLDELKEAGRLDGFSRLLTKGRDFGVRVAIGFQDVDGLGSVYGEKTSNEILGMCVNKAVLRLDSHNTAAWAASAIGDAELNEISHSRSYSSSGNSDSYSEQVVMRKPIIASELLTLPPVNRSAFSGYYIVPTVGVFPAKIQIGDNLSPLGDVPNFVERPVEHQYLEPWTPDDIRRLNLPSDLLDDDSAKPMPPPDPDDDLSHFSRMTRDPV